MGRRDRTVVLVRTVCLEGVWNTENRLAVSLSFGFTDDEDLSIKLQIFLSEDESTKY